MATNLINITIGDYYELNDRLRYDLILDSLVQRKEFNDIIYHISDLSYSEVKFIYKLIPETDKGHSSICKIYKILYKIDDKTFYSSSIVELFSTLKEIISTFISLRERELKLLKPSNDGDDALWSAAGGESLAPFSNVLPLIEIGKLFGQYPYDLQEKKYEEILVLLAATKRQSEVYAQYNILKTKRK